MDSFFVEVELVTFRHLLNNFVTG